MKKPDEVAVEQIAEDGREPYESPSLETEELYEVLALTCGKIFGHGGGIRCSTAPSAS